MKTLLSLLLLSAVSATAHADSIVTPSGKRLSLAGKANLAAVNAWLASRGERFEAGATPDFGTETYWGLDFQNEAYVWLDVTEYDDSTWAARPLARTGSFSIFTMTVYGFRTDAAGNRVDFNGDGMVDGWDWVGLDVQTLLSGEGTVDTAKIVAMYNSMTGAGASARASALARFDAAGYPNRAVVGPVAPKLNGTNTLQMTIGGSNPNRCTPQHAEWEVCYYWDATSGDQISSYPAPRSVDRVWAFQHSGNNWVRFNASTDSVNTNAQLGSLLSSISYQPLFWVRANDTSFDLN